MAYLSQCSPQPDLHMPPSLSSMSVAILPSVPMTYSQVSVPSLQPPTFPSKRPRLTLNTVDAPTLLGKGSTSLRLETLSATSPTIRNTFRNGYERDPSLQSRFKPALTPLSTSGQSNVIRTPSPLPMHVPSPTDVPELEYSSATSISSSSTLDSLQGEAPYTLPHDAKSILINGPLPKSPSARTPLARSRPMFATPKKVVFKADLTEDIYNSKYLVSDYDMEGASPVDVTSGLEVFPKEVSQRSSERLQRAAREPGRGEKRASTEEEEEQEQDDETSIPATPAKVKPNDRQWVWTLGPLDGVTAADEQTDGDVVHRSDL